MGRQTWPINQKGTFNYRCPLHRKWNREQWGRAVPPRSGGPDSTRGGVCKWDLIDVEQRCHGSVSRAVLQAHEDQVQRPDPEMHLAWPGDRRKARVAAVWQWLTGQSKGTWSLRCDQESVLTRHCRHSYFSCSENLLEDFRQQSDWSKSVLSEGLVSCSAEAGQQPWDELGAIANEVLSEVVTVAACMDRACWWLPWVGWSAAHYHAQDVGVWRGSGVPLEACHM